MYRDALVALSITLVLFVFASVALSLHKPPNAVSEDAPETVFSAERAMTHLQVIASEPRPIGSRANDDVRDYLFDELRKMGMAPEIQRATTVAGWRVVDVQNVVARLKGSTNNKAILLVAHFDSVPMSYGAGDAGSAVAAILETLRALQAGPQLKNDVIVLFSNPEEIFLHGGRAFIEEHPWANNVGLVVNIDPGGVSGPAYMHETSPENGWLISIMADVVPHPVASSLAYAVKKMQGDRNDEFHLFAEAGISGYNISFFDGDVYYHTRMDRVDQLDTRSLQHLGSYALSLTRHFGNADDLDRTERDAVYFNLPGWGLVHYSTQWAIPMMLLGVLLFAAVLILGRRTKRLTWSGMGKGILAFLISILGLPVLVLSVWWALFQVTSLFQIDLTGNVYNGVYLLIGFSGLAVAGFSAIYIWFSKKVTTEDLALGALWCWLALMVGTAIVMPGGSYLFTWPLWFSLLALIYSFFTHARKTSTRFATAVLTACAVPGILLIVPTIYIIFVAMSMSDMPIIMILVVLLLGLLVPHFFLVIRPYPRVVPSTSILVAVIFILAASSTSFDAEHPETDFILYGLNSESSEAIWASRSETNRDPDAWVASFFTGPTREESLVDFYPWSSSMFLQGSAPMVELLPPKLEILSDSISGDVRNLHLLVTSPRKAPIMIVVSDRPVISWSVQGKPIESQQVMAYWNFPQTGTDLHIEIEATELLDLVIVDQSYGLPIISGREIEPRPVDKMPAPSGGLIFSDATLVRTAVTL